MNHQCLFCFCRAFDRLLERHVESNARRLELAKRFFSMLAAADTAQPTPAIARDIHALIREYLNNSDPYQEEKAGSNAQALAVYDEMKAKVERSPHPFNTALRYALAGNIIDYGPSHAFDLIQTLEKVETSDFAVDHSGELEQKAARAGNILYLGDNAGEIVFDRLFIETMAHPGITFAVRGAPVINDVTLQDAREVNMHDVATVVTNGYDAPSTILEKSSPEFRRVFDRADLIIAKGQGNLEGLMHRDDPRLWFLLTVKCQVIGDHLGVNKGDFVVSNNHHPGAGIF
jgi:damage-control phosphatase, subfamily I